VTIHHEEATKASDCFEIVRGEVVSLMPTGDAHSDVEVRIIVLLFELQQQGLGLARVGEVGVVVAREPQTVRGADAAFLLSEQLPHRITKEGYLMTPPALVVEVVSPNDRASDIQEKVMEYLAAGVLVVWVVYPGSRTLCVHLADGTARTLKAEERLSAPGVLELQSPVSRLFEGLDAFRPVAGLQPPDS
jgi:Uma2 family endonuclease